MLKCIVFVRECRNVFVFLGMICTCMYIHNYFNSHTCTHTTSQKHVHTTIDYNTSTEQSVVLISVLTTIGVQEH